MIPVACALLLLAPLPAVPSAGVAGPGAVSGEVVTLGLFLPRTGPDLRLATAIRRGAEVAVERANREPANGGPLFRLVEARSDLPWNGASRELVRLIYEEGAVAVIGATDSRIAHLAEQVIARARGRAVFLTPWASADSLTGPRIPWFFRLVPGDRRQARLLAAGIFGERGFDRACTWVEDGPDHRAAAAAFLDAAPGGSLQPIRDGIDCNAIVLFGSPERSGARAREVRDRRPAADLFGPLSLARHEFLEAAGTAVEGMTLAGIAAGADAAPIRRAFLRRFRRAYGVEAGPAAQLGHDAALVAIEAIRHSGAGPPEPLADTIRRLGPVGATGPLTFDPAGNRAGEPKTLRIRTGRFHPVRTGESADAGRRER